MSKFSKYKSVSDIRNEIEAFFLPLDLKVLLTFKNQSEEDIKKVFALLDRFVSKNFKGISPNQLRKLVDLLPEPIGLNRLKMTRPQFALMIAKERMVEAKFMMLLVDEVAKVADADTIDGFGFFKESLLGFHRFHHLMKIKKMKPEYLPRDILKDLKHKNERADNLKIEHLLGYGGVRTDEIVNRLELFLNKNYRGIKTNQLRNLYDEILKDDSLKNVKLRRPVLLHTAARQEQRESLKLVRLIIELIDKATDLTQLKKLIEAIVSIHKYSESQRGRVEKSNPNQFFKPFDLMTLLEMRSKVNISRYSKIQSLLKEFVLENGAGLKPSQFHRILHPIQTAESLIELKMLSPLLLYTAARQDSPRAKKIILFLVELIKTTSEENHLEDFRTLTEDLISYHRYFASVAEL